MTTPGTVTWLRELAERNGWEVDTIPDLWEQSGCFMGTLSMDPGFCFYTPGGFPTKALARRALARRVQRIREAE